MGVNELRTLLMVAAFVAFVGIVLWACSRERKEDFERAARLPLDEDAMQDNPATPKTSLRQ